MAENKDFEVKELKKVSLIPLGAHELHSSSKGVEADAPGPDVISDHSGLDFGMNDFYRRYTHLLDNQYRQRLAAKEAEGKLRSSRLDECLGVAMQQRQRLDQRKNVKKLKIHQPHLR